MFLERLIIARAEKKLVPYREQAESIKREYAERYESYVPQIAALYAQTTHWHGTGRYHYEHPEHTRYGEVNSDSMIDVLTEIIKTNGLRPHEDPWIDTGYKTVSLATTRMHARVFARVHACTDITFVYELGSIKFWIRLYFSLLAAWLFAYLPRHLKFVRNLLRPSFSQDVQNWGSALRKPMQNRVARIIDIFRGDIPSSDIDGNYPILIGIVPNPNCLVETISFIHKVEQRSLQSVTIDMFTHLEVPLQNVAETECLLRKRNVSLPVIPLEYGDLYLANEPLEKLAFL